MGRTLIGFEPLCAQRWTPAGEFDTLAAPMVPRSAYADLASMPVHTGCTAFAWSTTLVNAQPTGA
jgi:hypothetical protein